MPTTEPSGRGRVRRGRRRRGLPTALTVVLGLIVTGTGYAALAPRPQVVRAAEPELDRGRALYERNCLGCHGRQLQGTSRGGPSLIGVGEAAVYFQVSTGRMPLARETLLAQRKPPPPQFDPATAHGRRNLRALGAYVQAHGGGPRLPEERGNALIGSDAARGGLLFRANCSSCHNFTGRGGALAEGKFAPNLSDASPDQLYAAMLSGPQAMPRFGGRTLAPGEKQDIIAYVLEVRGQRNAPGGFNLGEFGPTAEGLVAFLVGVAALVGISLWLGARS